MSRGRGPGADRPTGRQRGRAAGEASRIAAPGAWARSIVAVVAALVALLAPRASAAADDGVLVVGMTGKYPPFNYFDEQGELAGFDVDFARALCAEIGRRCELRTLQWDGLIGALLAGRIDAVVGSMAITEERSRAVRFSAPYYESGARLFVRPGAGDPRRPGFAIGVTLGTTYEAAAARAFPRAEIRTLKGDTDVVQDLVAGRLDGMITDDHVGAYLLRERGGVVERHGERLLEERIGIPVRPGDEALLAEIDRGIAALRASGKQAELLAKHVDGRTVEGAPAEATQGLAWRSAPRLLGAAARTVALCLVGLGAGALLSLLLAGALVARPLVARPVAAWVDFVRSTPFLVQLFALYFGPPALGLRIDAWTCGALAIALHSSAYLAVILETAYRSVPDGQRLAARSLGLGPGETLRWVLVPQMLPVCTPPALSTVVAMIKDSAVVSSIGVLELTLQTQQLVAATYRPLELYAMAAGLYFVMTWPLLWAGRRLEARWREAGLLHG
jgi:His/Glu/Gln/Arg/opine family amino acid ABC transporter permease subunit